MKGGIANWATKRVFAVMNDENKRFEGRLLGDIADEVGRDPFDVLCDIAVADDLLTSFGTDDPTSSDAEWKARLELWRDDRVVIGASDAGAHLDLLATFNQSTVLLGEAVRELGLLSLEEAVHLITQVPAELYGLVERGVIAEGNHADLVVFDPDSVGTAPTVMRNDLPGGAGRLFAGRRTASST